MHHFLGATANSAGSLCDIVHRDEAHPLGALLDHPDGMALELQGGWR